MRVLSDSRDDVVSLGRHASHHQLGPARRCLLDCVGRAEQASAKAIDCLPQPRTELTGGVLLEMHLSSGIPPLLHVGTSFSALARVGSCAGSAVTPIWFDFLLSTVNRRARYARACRADALYRTSPATRLRHAAVFIDLLFCPPPPLPMSTSRRPAEYIVWGGVRDPTQPLPPHAHRRSVNATDTVPPKIDYGIVTIKEEEFLALQIRFGAVKLIPGRNRRYWKGVAQTRTGQSRTIALVRCVAQGQGEAQSVASDLIADLKPSWILVVGIAGALPAEEFGLGDVLLASRLLDFSVQAAIEDKPPELDTSGSRVHPSVEELLSIIPGAAAELGPWNTRDNLGRLRPALNVPGELGDDRYYGDNAWRSRVQNALRTRFRGDRATHQPRLRIGGVASSSILVKDTQLVNEWKSAARSITHIEMELGGVYRAAWTRSQIVPVLSVRGISDIVGFRRDAEWTDYACETAAAFVGALIRSDLPFFDDGSTRPGPAIVDLSGADPENLPADVRAVEITWDIDLNDVSPHLERELLGTVSPLAKMSEVAILHRELVSVKITVAVTDEQIRRLLAAVPSGRLASAGIKSVDIVPTDVRD